MTHPFGWWFVCHVWINSNSRVSPASSCILREPLTSLSHTIKENDHNLLPVNAGGVTVPVEEVSILDDITEWSRPLRWQIKYYISSPSAEMKNSWAHRVNRAVSPLTCVLPRRDGDGRRSHERVFILQCYDITADNSNKFNTQAPPSRLAR